MRRVCRCSEADCKIGRGLRRKRRYKPSFVASRVTYLEFPLSSPRAISALAHGYPVKNLEGQIIAPFDSDNWATFRLIPNGHYKILRG